MSVSSKAFSNLLRLAPKRTWTQTNFRHMTKEAYLRAKSKGGEAVSQNTEHMKEIGTIGGKHGGGPHRKPGTPYAHPEISRAIRAEKARLRK